MLSKLFGPRERGSKNPAGKPNYTGVETQGSDCSTESKERLLREGLQVFQDKEKAFEFVDSGLKGRNINCVQFFDGACNSLKNVEYYDQILHRGLRELRVVS
jgi:hypothetical protein